MTGVVVDMDVFSFFFKNDSRAPHYLQHLNNRSLHLGFPTVAELFSWTIRHSWGKARVNDLLKAIQEFTVLGYDEPCAREWARITTIKGRPIAVGDGWIAAIALRHNLPLVTHNRRHYEHIPGVVVLSEAP